ncbi:hypothetical protein LCGC14_1619360 [marine sediment metagenome]|uniref:PAS domain-containing protein n=1 Tax=marine sediment metagenome TaxID=412755 RepID=A0A0F9KLL8_9ZZZZ
MDLAKFPSENPNPVLRVSKDKVIYINKAGQDLINVQANDPVPNKLLESINRAIKTNSAVTLEIEFSNKLFVFNITPTQKVAIS